jgi:hypothetical protein
MSAFTATLTDVGIDAAVETGICMMQVNVVQYSTSMLQRHVGLVKTILQLMNNQVGLSVS